MKIRHEVERDDLALGLVRATGVRCSAAPESLAAELARVAAERAPGIKGALEQRRKLSRELLRNGKYKPTGRSKPANEYLLRSAMQGQVPRVNGPVDANNLISLKYMVPVSLWDTDLANTDEYLFRLGRSGESYVFNSAGQQIELEDLITGYRLGPAGEWIPSVNPVKDSLATKTTEATHNVAACIYYPLDGSERDRANLEEITKELVRWLTACGSTQTAVDRVLLRGEAGSF